MPIVKPKRGTKRRKRGAAPIARDARAGRTSADATTVRANVPVQHKDKRAPQNRRQPPRIAVDASPSNESEVVPVGQYVYCVIRERDPLRFGPIGLGASRTEVYTVAYHDISAVVSDTPIEPYDPTRENVLAHEEVNEMVMRTHSVIPMSFGTVFRTRQDTIQLLRSAYDAFLAVLTKVEGKVEYGLKVLWDRAEMVRTIENENEDIRRLKAEISSDDGSTYFARMQYGRMLDTELELRSERFVSQIFNALRDVAVASRANRPIGDKMLMNAAFLVNREREAAFDQRVRELGAALDGLTLKYTGPWPPYNFVNIRLKLERPGGTQT